MDYFNNAIIDKMRDINDDTVETSAWKKAGEDLVPFDWKTILTMVLIHNGN